AADDPELEELADARITRAALQRLGQGEGARRHRAVLVREQVHHPYALPDAVAGEVDHDVVALGDSQLVQRGDGDWSRQQVAVVGDLNHRRGVGERDLEAARRGAVQDAE